MHSDKPKIKEIFKDLTFTSEEVEAISSVFHKENHIKGSQLLKANEQGDQQYYVVSGCLRLYYVDDNGKEHIVQFAVKDWWICDCTAFFSETKAILNIETITDAVVYKLSKKDRDSLYTQIPKIESFFRKKIERALASFQKRTVVNLSQSATERYKYFVNTYPNIEQHIKNYHIASFLGITTESLSRIRKELAKN